MLQEQKLIFDLLMDKKCLGKTIENLAELLNVSTSSISSYHKETHQKNFRSAKFDPDEFYELVFAKIASDEIKQSAAMQSICNYLNSIGKLNDSLIAYKKLGYQSFIRVLLSYRIDDIPYPFEITARPEEYSASLTPVSGLCQVYPSLSLKVFGRENLLNKIFDMLNTNGLVLLSGIGGIGKSCISLKFIDSYKNRYHHIQHVYFEKSIKRTILKLSFYGLNEENKTDDEKFQIRMNELYKYSADTLLVIDNMDIKEEELDKQNYSDLKRSKIHLLITSRYGTTFESDENILNVNKLSENHQKELFYYHYKALLPTEEEQLMKDILLQVDGHTLLIELIAKTMRNGDINAQEMLDILKKDYDEADSIIYIEKDQKKGSFKMDEYVGLLFDTSNLSDDEKDTLKLLSLVPLEGISRKLFKSLSGNSNATISLTNGSWVITERSEDLKYRLRLHPVICRVVLDRTHPDFSNCSLFLNNVKEKLNEHANHSAADITDLANLVHNLIEILECRTKEEIDYLLLSAGRLRELCYYSLSIDIFEFLIKRIQDMTETFSSNEYHTLLQHVYIESAQVYIRLAHYLNAIECYEHAITLTQEKNNSIELADLYNHLGFVYRKSSEYEKALEFYKKAKDLLSNLPDGSTNPVLGDTYNDLGIVYINKRDYEDALECYKKGLEIRNQCVPKNPLKLAYSYHNIGTVYQRLGNIPMAIENHSKALEIRENCSEPPMLEIAASYAQIGNDHTSDNQFKEAIDYYQKALEIREKYLHENHPDIAWIKSSIGDWHFKQSEYKEAAENFQEVLRIRDISLGRQHAYTAEALYKLGCCSRMLGNNPEAKQYLLEAKHIQENKNLVHALQLTQAELELL